MFLTLALCTSASRHWLDFMGEQRGWRWWWLWWSVLRLWMKVKPCCHADAVTPASAPKNSTAQQCSPRCRPAASSKVGPLKRSKRRTACLLESGHKRQVFVTWKHASSVLRHSTSFQACNSRRRVAGTWLKKEKKVLLDFANALTLWPAMEVQKHICKSNKGYMRVCSL